MDTAGQIAMWFLFFLLINTACTDCRVVSVVDESCGHSNCKCCATNQCSSDGVCTDGCKPGYHGGRCRNKCADNCVTCTDHPDTSKDKPELNGIGYCTACNDGHYFTDEFYQCQSTCSSGCKTCLSGSNCTSCQTGHFPDIQNSGSCIICPHKCISCNESNGCSSCMTGYYHTLSDGQGRCIICPDNCISCESAVNCILCNNDYYGTTCHLKCSNGCRTPCQKENGACQCKPNFVGEKCNSCVTGSFGNDCTESCPQNCQNNECDRLSGYCYACIGNLILPKCENCANGLHGIDCETRCPNNCINKTCDQSTGKCSFGCKGNLTGDTCDQCSIGKFGNECENECPKMCLNNICDMMTGHCSNCSTNFTGNKCEDCIIGVYGHNCNLSCPPNCQESKCNRKDGTCKNGCIFGYSWDMCCFNNTFCGTCSSFYECDICIDGKYGQTCENNCSINCEPSCDKYNGSCYSCKEGFEGQVCEVPVSQPSKQDENGIAVPIAGTLSSITIVSVIALLIIICYRRRISSNKQTKLENVYYNLPKGTQSDKEENTMQEMRGENQELRHEIDQSMTSSDDTMASSVYTILDFKNNAENPYSQIKTANV